MTEAVIDASALLALLNNEPGADIVADVILGGVISSVNLSEVISKLSELGVPGEAIHQILQPLAMNIIPFDEEQAYQTGFLRTSTQNMGLSLGDRACLCLAKMLGLPAITADRAWVDLAIGVVVKVIRS